MARSKNRALWSDLPPAVHAEIQRIAGGQVVAAVNCPGGYSPGFASRLTLADGRQVFAKAINATEWPSQLETYRAEARTAALLPRPVPAPALHGTTEAGNWLALVFEEIAGQEPDQPWRPDDLSRTLEAIKPHKAPAHLSTDHPRLGGWQTVSNDRRLIDQLKALDPWGYENLDLLTDLETHGLVMAKVSTWSTVTSIRTTSCSPKSRCTSSIGLTLARSATTSSASAAQSSPGSGGERPVRPVTAGPGGRSRRQRPARFGSQ
jgi:hypothetical protein